jgi:hypothetical protein
MGTAFSGSVRDWRRVIWTVVEQGIRNPSANGSPRTPRNPERARGDHASRPRVRRSFEKGPAGRYRHAPQRLAIIARPAAAEIRPFPRRLAREGVLLPKQRERADQGWQRRFDEPIELPDGRELHTLADAIAWLANKIPESEHGMKQVQAAAHCITEAAENDGPMTFARIGTMQAINRHRVREFDSRKTTHWGKRRLKRDR